MNPRAPLAGLIVALAWFAARDGVAQAGGGEPPAAPVVPAALHVPAGASLVARFHATGAQVYRCAQAAGHYGWTLERPDATLLDAGGAPIGTHTAGPTWTITKDGSSVKAEKVAQADAPAAGAVPWLLLRATSTAGHGQLSQVTYIQRLGTQGGKPPATGCDAQAAGKEARAAYSADYVFYTGAAAKPSPAKKP